MAKEIDLKEIPLPTKPTLIDRMRVRAAARAARGEPLPVSNSKFGPLLQSRVHSGGAR